MYRTSGVLNIAQGEMATFGTYIAYVLSSTATPALFGAGLAAILPFTPWPMWLSILVAMAISAVFGAALELLVFRRLRNRPPQVVTSATVGLFLLINGITAQWWFAIPRDVTSVFPDQPDDYIGIGGARFRFTYLGVLLVVVGLLVALELVLNRTRLGLAFRAVAQSREHAELVGIRSDHVVAVGWALAAAIGTLIGGLVAPRLLLTPTMMVTIVVYALAAALLGGLDSSVGVVLGGLAIGVVTTMLAGYVEPLGPDLSVVVALVVLLIVLLVRPTGLFGAKQVERA